MFRRWVDDPVLFLCLSLWKREFGRAGDEWYATKLTVLIVLWALMLIAGLNLALLISIGIGSAVLFLAFIFVAPLKSALPYVFVRREPDWLSGEQNAAMSRFIARLKSEGGFEASDLPNLIALVDKRVESIDKERNDLQTLVTGAFATGVFGAVCSLALNTDESIAGASMWETAVFILAFATHLIVLGSLLAEFLQCCVIERIWISRSDLVSCRSVLYHAGLSCFEGCWMEGGSIGKHAKRTCLG